MPVELCIKTTSHLRLCCQKAAALQPCAADNHSGAHIQYNNTTLSRILVKSKIYRTKLKKDMLGGKIRND